MDIPRDAIMPRMTFIPYDEGGMRTSAPPHQGGNKNESSIVPLFPPLFESAFNPMCHMRFVREDPFHPPPYFVVRALATASILPKTESCAVEAERLKQNLAQSFKQSKVVDNDKVQFITRRNGEGSTNIGWELGQDAATREKYTNYWINSDAWKKEFFSMSDRSNNPSLTSEQEAERWNRDGGTVSNPRAGGSRRSIRFSRMLLSSNTSCIKLGAH